MGCGYLEHRTLVEGEPVVFFNAIDTACKRFLHAEIADNPLKGPGTTSVTDAYMFRKLTNVATLRATPYRIIYMDLTKTTPPF